MSNIFGIDGFFDNNRVQNLSAITGSTSVSGQLLVSGKAYVGSSRPIMSGGFTMITPVTVANTTDETVLIGAGLGTLSSAANTIQVGQSSHSVASGNLSINASPTLTIRIRGGPTSTVDLATFAIPLTTVTAGSAWKLTSDYTVKAIGTSGVAQIYINSVFTVYDISNARTYANFGLNTTTFDTTVANVITMTAQWSAASPGDTVTCQQFTTNSVYAP